MESKIEVCISDLVRIVIFGFVGENFRSTFVKIKVVE